MSNSESPSLNSSFNVYFSAFSNGHKSTEKTAVKFRLTLVTLLASHPLSLL